MKAILTENIRERNRSLILEQINRQEAMSRAEIARSTGLNKASVSEIVGELLDEGLLLETALGKSSGGRRPIPLILNPHRYHILACDLAPHELRLCVGDLHGGILLRESLKLKPKRREIKEQLLTAIRDLLRRYDGMVGERDDAHPEPPTIAAMTLSIYGVVARDEILFTPYYDLQGLDLQAFLTSELRLPVYLMNEADLAANGEWAHLGPVDNLLSLKIREGLGLGIILQGHREHGANGFAGEFGHSILVPNGLPCPCGNRGCLDQYLSELALLQAFAESAAGRRADLGELLAAYEAQDPTTRRLIAAYEDYLSVSLNNLLRLFDPRLILLNSRVATGIPGFLDSLRSKLNCHIPAKYEIRLSRLGDDATLLGGIALGFEKVYGLSRFFFNPLPSAVAAAGDASGSDNSNRASSDSKRDDNRDDIPGSHAAP